MRIESIDFHRSSETELALITSPPFDRNVYLEFQKLVADAAPLNEVHFREEASRLCIIAPSLSLNLREAIESYLTAAENTVAQTQRMAAEQEKLSIQRKERAVSTAARALGLKIRRLDSDFPRLPPASQ
jgi:hypothetical protein